MENGAESWSFQTFARIRPPVNGYSESINYTVTDAVVPIKRQGAKHFKTIHLEIPEGADPGLVHSNTSGTIPFTFNDVFQEDTSQEELFNHFYSMVLDTFRGISSTILAYGQTGSGKTYTICGGDSFDDRGLIPRAISLVFDNLRRNTSHKCYISFMEVFGEAVYDLLDANKRYQRIEDWSRIQLLENEEGIILKNLNVFELSHEEDALNLFFMGVTNRITSSTAMNHASSRSHAIFTIMIEGETLKHDQRVLTRGKINLVDLAGSERVYKVSNSQGTIKEGKAINLSLHFLEQVIINLRHSNHKSKHIPYRNSMLTNILRDSLGGSCKSCFILTLSCDLSSFEESVSTCRFGQRCGEVTVKVQPEEEIELSDQLKVLKRRIRHLEEQITTLQNDKNRLATELRAYQITPRTPVITEDERAACRVLLQRISDRPKRSSDMSLGSASNSSISVMNEIKTLSPPLLQELCESLVKLVQNLADQRDEYRSRSGSEVDRHEEKDDLQLEDIRARLSSEDLGGDKMEYARADALLGVLVAGQYMMKNGALGTKKRRYVYLSDDYTLLCWVHKQDNKSQPHSLELRTVKRAVVRHKGKHWFLTITCDHGKVVEFEFIFPESNSEGECRKSARVWSEVLNLCVEGIHANETSPQQLSPLTPSPLSRQESIKKSVASLSQDELEGQESN